MIQIFTGDDRVKAGQEIIKLLGKDHETIEGADLTASDLPSIFKGVSLFADHRRILIRDLLANKQVADRITDYLDTPHDIILQELKLDKRSSIYKALKSSVTIKEFKSPRDPNAGLVFDIYNVAKRDGKRAISMLEQIKPGQDPIMFFGLIASQAIKDYNRHHGTKEKKALKELSQLDLTLKSSPLDSWLLIESFLIRLASL